MPELPEVEHIRRSLEPLIVGSRVTNVKLRRRDVIRQTGRIGLLKLLHGATITGVTRHGKELAIVAEDGRTLAVHLGMSGWLSWIGAESAATNGHTKLDHVHCIWDIDGPCGTGVLRFRDPRRFGGLWTFPSLEDWQAVRLAGRGPDALAIKSQPLVDATWNSRRAIKAALLDQSVLAGVGNIYADEALYAARIHPATLAGRLARDVASIRSLCRHLRTILAKAIDSGGSTVRSYRGLSGDAGQYALQHKVYGKAGAPCMRCSRTLKSIQLVGRTTVFCPQCQPWSRQAKRQARLAASPMNE